MEDVILQAMERITQLEKTIKEKDAASAEEAKEKERKRKRQRGNTIVSDDNSSDEDSSESSDTDTDNARALTGKPWLDEEPPAISSRRRRQEMQRERFFKPAEPKEFNGGGVGDTREFARNVESVFRTQPHIYYTQAEKFTYARSRLRGKLADRWDAHEQANPLSDTIGTWVNLKKWMLDQAQDPMNRDVAASIRFFTHEQREHQRIEDYVAWLESLQKEIDMPRLTEGQMMRRVVAGIRPALREKLMEQPKLVWKRTPMVRILGRLEENLRMGSSFVKKDKRPRHAEEEMGGTTPKSWDEAKPKGKGREGGTQGRTWTPATGSNTFNISKIQCYYCKEHGHFRDQCPKMNRGTEGSGKA